jgi:pyrroloquinoline quinone biosynthesis protein B
MRRLTAIVLGAAAGGGFPQWNCRCPVCALAWGGDPRVRRRTQASVAVSADGEHWLMLNASPDLRDQILANPVLHPRGDVRTSPIDAVLLTGAEIDQAAGLLTLREGQSFTIHASAAVLAMLADNPMFGVLHSAIVSRRALTPGERLVLTGGFSVEIFPVPGKIPFYLEGEDPKIDESGANIGVELAFEDRRLIFIPAAAAVTPALLGRLRRANVVLFDGTLYSDDEMITTGTGSKTGRRMGHMPIDGPGGSLGALADLSGRLIFIHINNTNPILIDGSPERRHVEAAGFEVAFDGMEIVA